MKISTKGLLLLSVSAVSGVALFWFIKKKRQQGSLEASGNWKRAYETPQDSIKDVTGNYDIDGVSYDRKGVIVGSESHHVTSPKHPRPEEMH